MAGPRDPLQRRVGTALTVPRHTQGLFAGAGREEEQADADEHRHGGPCLAPRAVRAALGHIRAADLRPHYVQQSNLAEDRVAYPVLDRVLADYRRLFAPAAPLVHSRPRAIARNLLRRAGWAEAVRNGDVTAYRVGRTVTVRAPVGVEVPVTAPAGTRAAVRPRRRGVRRRVRRPGRRLDAHRPAPRGGRPGAGLPLRRRVRLTW